LVVTAEWGVTGVWWVEAREAAPLPTVHRMPPPHPLAKSSCLQMSILLSLRNLEFEAGGGDSNSLALCLWDEGMHVQEEVDIFLNRV